jgi:hypothetical protein
MHGLIAAIAAHHAGWTALPNDAVWWLIIGGLPLASIGFRTWLDARESRLAATTLAVAFLSYAAGLASFLAAWPVADPQGATIVTAGATLLGHWLLFVGAVSYARYVVLDAQGLVSARRGRQSKASVKKREATDVPPRITAGSRPIDAGTVTPSSGAAAPRPLNSFRQSLTASPPVERTSAQWVDGSEPVDDDYENDDAGPRDRKLSKAERKRLRKLKARDRAA